MRKISIPDTGNKSSSSLSGNEHEETKNNLNMRMR